MAATARLTIVMAACLLISSCSETVTATTAEPLPAPTERTTTTAGQEVASDSSSGLSRSPVEVDFGVSQITATGSGLFGLAVQDFNAPSSLIEQGDTGCVGFQAGRTGEVVWSTDGVAWEPLPVQPYWYRGALSPERWGQIVGSGGFPSQPALVELVDLGDRLLAVSFSELTAARGRVVVDVYDTSMMRWERLGVLGSVGSSRSAVAAAGGPDGVLVVAIRPDGSPSAWSVSAGSLVEVSGPAESWIGDDEGWVDQVTEIALVATNDGFLAQFDVQAGPPVMAFTVDGRSWTRVRHPSAGPVHLAASGETVLAANGDGMWISADEGQSWRLVAIDEGIQLVDITGAESGFATWFLAESWSSPTVWFSVDGIEWEPILELSDDYNWINGLIITDEAIVISASVPSNGWVCPDIERYEYEIHIARFG